MRQHQLLKEPNLILQRVKMKGIPIALDVIKRDTGPTTVHLRDRTNGSAIIVSRSKDTKGMIVHH